MQKLDYIAIDPADKPKASVIWLHGLGADGHDFIDIAPKLGLSKKLDVRFVFPHAPIRSVTLNSGIKMRAWFDIFGLDVDMRQDEEGIRLSEELIYNYIDQELALGVPSEKIVLAGFSQGASMALHCGLRCTKKLAGVIALSGFLPLADTLSNEISEININTPIFMAHGQYDNIVSLGLGELSKNELVAQGCDIKWSIYPMQHTVCPEEIADIRGWLQRVVNL